MKPRNSQRTATMNLSATFLSTDKARIAVKIVPLPLSARTPKHLAFLTDTSGSMEGDRMESVKRTLHLLVDALPVDDVFSLIRYSSESTVPLNSVKITEDRTALHTKIDALYADNGTNLESAVLQLKTLENVDSVFLLTDGHINEGITAASGLLRILGPFPPPLNTLGYGADYNTRTLKKLSLNTRGSHTYADAAELIPAIIGDIVGGLAAEVGKNGCLEIPAGWRCLEQGYTEGDTTYNVGSLVAEKVHWVVLEAPADTPEPSSLAFTWQTDKAITVHFFLDDEIQNVEIMEQYNRCRVAQVFGEATEMLEVRDREAAKKMLQALQTELTTSVAKDRPFVIRLLAQVDEMLEEFSNAYLNPDLVPRMNSNMVALGVQRGIVSRLQSMQPGDVTSRAMTGVLDSFSSPSQRLASAGMSNKYSQQTAH